MRIRDRAWRRHQAWRWKHRITALRYYGGYWERRRAPSGPGTRNAAAVVGQLARTRTPCSCIFCNGHSAWEPTRAQIRARDIFREQLAELPATN